MVTVVLVEPLQFRQKPFFESFLRVLKTLPSTDYILMIDCIGYQYNKNHIEWQI